MVLHPNLIDPKSIVVIGGSDHLDHLGGSVIKNLLDQGFKGDLLAVNPKRSKVQGITCYPNAKAIPGADLGIIAIPAEISYEAIRVLVEEKGTRAFLLYSAGFSECGGEGRVLEEKLYKLLKDNDAVLLGPNNIGLINRNYAGIFTRPVPKLDPNGVDFVSGSGATAVFTIEAAMQVGLRFNSLYTVGNSMQIGIEEILEYWDQTHRSDRHGRIKMLYIEGIRKPSKFLKHCTSLRKKGCHIVAMKSGVTEAGGKAASSHTGAMATDDLFVQTLFDYAGIIRCHSRYGLVTTAAVLHQAKNKASKYAIVTHAGGPGVIATDSLTKHGLKVPAFKREQSDHLRSLLYPGAACDNPIDILATGTAEQLGAVIDYCDRQIDDIDGIIVIFGSPGLRSVQDAFHCIHQKMRSCRISLFPVLPSVINVKEEISEFIEKGNVAFFDESLLSQGLRKMFEEPDPVDLPITDTRDRSSKLLTGLNPGYLNTELSYALIQEVGIDQARPHCVNRKEDLEQVCQSLSFPLAMKADGLLHKSDQKGVILHIQSLEEMTTAFDHLTSLEGCTGVLIQAMVEGLEVYMGAKRVQGFPPLVFCGFGGIYLEIVEDLAQGFAPLTRDQAHALLRQLKMFKVLKGARGQQGVDLEKLAAAMVSLSELMHYNPEIVELDINPLKVTENYARAVDVRIKIG